MYPQLVQYVVNVVLDRGDLHAEFPSDFLVPEPTVNEPYNLALPVLRWVCLKPDPPASPATRRSNIAAIRGGQATSPRATLARTARSSAEESLRVTYPATPASAHATSSYSLSASVTATTLMPGASSRIACAIATLLGVAMSSRTMSVGVTREAKTSS